MRLDGGVRPCAQPRATFLEGEPLPVGYYEPPNPYVIAPSCHVDLPALSKYAKETGKKLTELTKEEVKKLAI